MVYFNFYCKNIEGCSSTNNERIVGTCYGMCPQVEVELRVREKMVHALEVVGSERKLVKSFSRSAADSNMTATHLLRPYATLKDTLHYLMFEVHKRTDVSSLVLYNFVEDRLRAIRQDMTIQRLSPKQCTYLLEPMIRFYVYYGYKLYDLPNNDYDPILNKKHLLECLKWFLNCSDKTDSQSDCPEDLTFGLSNLNMSSDIFNKDRVLIETLYILCNLGDIHPLKRYYDLPKDIKRRPLLQLAYGISLAYIMGNYIKLCRLLKNLCPLSYYAVFLHLPNVQRHALRAMSHAYNSKQLMVPREAIRDWIHFSSNSEVQSICQHYGLTTPGDAVRFSKADFKIDVALHTLQKNGKDQNISIKDILGYTTDDYNK